MRLWASGSSTPCPYSWPISRQTCMHSWESTPAGDRSEKAAGSSRSPAVNCGEEWLAVKIAECMWRLRRAVLCENGSVRESAVCASLFTYTTRAECGSSAARVVEEPRFGWRLSNPKLSGAEPFAITGAIDAGRSRPEHFQSDESHPSCCSARGRRVRHPSPY